MVYIEVCVGSSCHLKGAPEIVELMQQHIADEQLEDDIILTVRSVPVAVTGRA